MDWGEIFNPYHTRLVGRFHYGEEVQDPEQLPKTEFVFPSREALPRCWLDPHYRDEQVFARRERR